MMNKKSSKRWKTRTHTHTDKKCQKKQHNKAQYRNELCEKEIYANGKWHSEAFYIIIQNMDSLSIMRYVCTEQFIAYFKNNHKCVFYWMLLLCSYLCVFYAPRQYAILFFFRFYSFVSNSLGFYSNNISVTWPSKKKTIEFLVAGAFCIMQFFLLFFRRNLNTKRKTCSRGKKMAWIFEIFSPYDEQK